MGQAARYAEIFLVGLVAALASYNYTITIGNFILPSKVSMYSVKPVLQHDRAFDIFDAGDADKVKSDKKIHDVIYATDFEPTGKHGDFNFYYLTPIQISKFVIGCYGNHSFDDEKLTVSTDYTNDGVNQLKTMLSGTWNSNVVDLWKKGVKDSKPALVTAAKANATKILDIWQDRAMIGNFGTESVCTCIDTAVRLTTEAKTGNIVIKNGNMYDIKPMDKVAGVGGGSGQHYASIVGFCQNSAIPIHAIQYEGTVGIPALLLVAQLCILLGLVHLWDLYMNRIHVQTADRVYKSAASNKTRRWIKITLSFIVVIVYMVRQTYDTDHLNDTNQKQQGFRSEDHTRAKYTSTNFVIIGSLFVVLLVELIYEYVASHAENEHTRVRYNKNSTMARIVERVGADVPTIIGFGLMGLAVLLQADVSNSTTVLGGVFILFTAGLIQHMSNVVKILYESICARLSSEVVVGLSLHDETAPTNDNEEVQRILTGAITDTNGGNVSANKGNAKIRDVLQFFGWTRLYFFMIVILLGIFFFTIAKDSSMTYALRGMLDGQLLYFTLAFIFSHIGFDAMYEMMPMSFDPAASEKLKIYFVSTYLLVFNLNQILHIRSASFRGESV